MMLEIWIKAWISTIVNAALIILVALGFSLAVRAVLTVFELSVMG